MTEETQNDAPATEETPSTEPIVEAEPTQAAPKSLPEDQEWNRVEFKDADTQRRFNRMYAQLKTQERVQSTIIETNRALMDKLEKIEADNSSKQQTSELDQLKQTRREALMSGDLVKADELDEQIFELRTKKATPKPEPKQAQPEPLDPEVNDRVTQWATETDDDGVLIRPFMHANHPEHKRAMALIQSVLTDETMYGKEIEDYVQAVDKVLEMTGVVKSKKRSVPTPAPVLQSVGRPRIGATKVALSSDEINVAKKMYSDDPDPIGRYIKAKEKLK